MNTRKHGFSLVEVLAAVSIIGVITFLALPNIIAVKGDAETSLAIARAEAVNIALANFIQSYGRTNATSSWAATTSDQDRYALVASYLAFAPSSESDYMPNGYGLTWPSSIATLSKIGLTGPSGSIAY